MTTKHERIPHILQCCKLSTNSCLPQDSGSLGGSVYNLSLFCSFINIQLCNMDYAKLWSETLRVSVGHRHKDEFGSRLTTLFEVQEQHVLTSALLLKNLHTSGHFLSRELSFGSLSLFLALFEPTWEGITFS